LLCRLLGLVVSGQLHLQPAALLACLHQRRIRRGQRCKKVLHTRAVQKERKNKPFESESTRC
jgi:hypothetical protein